MLARQLPDADEVACVIFPLAGRQMLVPSVCIAEVLPWQRPRVLADAPRWCAGEVDWHGTWIPVVDIDALDAARAPEAVAGRCLVVLNRTTPGAGRSFYALFTSGIPRLVKIAGDDVAAEASPAGSTELLRLRVGTEDLVIPDLGAVERHLGELTA